MHLRIWLVGLRWVWLGWVSDSRWLGLDWVKKTEPMSIYDLNLRKTNAPIDVRGYLYWLRDIFCKCKLIEIRKAEKLKFNLFA